MGGSTLTHALPESDVAIHEDTTSREDSPAIKLLDALRSRDDQGVLEVCGETTTMAAHAMGWSCQGRDDIQRMLTESRAFFPGLTVEPRTRNIGFGLVIEDVRVQDVVPSEESETGAETGSESGSESGAAGDESHPMWDEPVSTQRALAIWREDFLTPMRLNLPVRITVRHDDLQVHEVIFEFPAALLKRALGLYVDPFEMSLSEVQSAVIAPVEAGFTTRTLAAPGLGVTPPAPPEIEVDVAEPTRPRRRRRRVLATLLVVLMALAAAGGWWELRGPGATDRAGASAVSTTPVGQATPNANAQPTFQPTSQPSSSQAPVVTHAKPTDTPSRKPNVTLKSEMAFAFNSATLSPQAKQAIDQVAHQVRQAGLSGKIYVDGYTDDLGSKAYGLVLSQRRADAVSHYLGSRLVGVPVSILSAGHGEADPIASNATNQGRQANRRVTITLPTS
jgi:outer membrane protein OmpA-like peptidoglycan-associated protein